MGVRVSGGSVSILGFGIDWERTQGDERIARYVLGFSKTEGFCSLTATSRTRHTVWRRRWSAARF
jgi:hypothetical protein